MQGRDTSAIAVITVEPADKISFVYNCMQTRLRGRYNGKWPISLVCVSRPLVTVITAIWRALSTSKKKKKAKNRKLTTNKTKKVKATAKKKKRTKQIQGINRELYTGKNYKFTTYLKRRWISCRLQAALPANALFHFGRQNENHPCCKVLVCHR